MRYPIRSTFRSVTIAVAVMLLAGLPPVARASVDIGKPAPSLVVDELGGKTFDLSALRGKIVVINFWATWCQPCRQEMPVLDSFYRQHHANGLDMLGLSVDRSRDRDQVLTVMKSFSYPAAMLDDAKDNSFGMPSALPETFVVDANGVLRARFTPDKNPVTDKSLDDAVLPLLQQGTTAAPSPAEK
jgi:cytochrome c biogenesis protein CcmG, thiol:disulfide interchange protein DsbE